MSDYTKKTEGCISKIVEVEETSGWCPFYVPFIGRKCVVVELIWKIQPTGRSPYLIDYVPHVRIADGDDGGIIKFFDSFPEAAGCFRRLNKESLYRGELIHKGFVSN